MPAQTGARRAAHSSIIVAAIVLCGCARDALDTPCPEVNVGELVVTELSGSDADPPWVEVYNATGAAIDLTGMRLTFTKLDGSDADTFVVQEEGAPEAAAGGYAVIESAVELPSGAAVDIVSCGRPIDRMIYRNLPDDGSFAFTGLVDPPDDAENDDESQWCPDIGSPGERNPECPE